MFPKQQTVATSTEVEHTSLLSLFDMLALLNRNLARAHFVHANTYERHQADCRVVSFDEDDCSSR